METRKRARSKDYTTGSEGKRRTMNDKMVVSQKASNENIERLQLLHGTKLSLISTIIALKASETLYQADLILQTNGGDGDDVERLRTMFPTIATFDAEVALRASESVSEACRLIADSLSCCNEIWQSPDLIHEQDIHEQPPGDMQLGPGRAGDRILSTTSSCDVCIRTIFDSLMDCLMESTGNPESENLRAREDNDYYLPLSVFYDPFSTHQPAGLPQKYKKPWPPKELQFDAETEPSYRTCREHQAMHYECNASNCLLERSGRSEDCTNRAITKLRQQDYSNLETFSAGDMGVGLRTKCDIKKGDKIIEYMGEPISMVEKDIRISHANQDTPHYIIKVDDKLGTPFLDARHIGNLARHLNHSCTPNCRIERWVVNNHACLVLVAHIDIPSGKELVFDYGEINFECQCPSCSESDSAAAHEVEVPTFVQPEVPSFPPAQHGQKWHENADSILMKLYWKYFTIEGTSWRKNSKWAEDVQTLLSGRSEKSCYTRALALSKGERKDDEEKNKHWSTKEDELLLSLEGRMSYPDMSRQLARRTGRACRSRMGILKRMGAKVAAE